MICDYCKINKATICLEEVFNDETLKLNLCNSCASKLNVEFSFSNLFKNFLEEIEEINFFNKLIEPKEVKKCDQCGNTFEKMKKTGKVGCSYCYTAFKEELKSTINAIQHSFEHSGKAPQRLNTKIKLKREIKDLKESLQNAVLLENYELAAELRDKIKEIEKRGN